MTRLNDDQFFRLEALRLAVQAGCPDHREAFYDFLSGRVGSKDQLISEVTSAVIAELNRIAAEAINAYWDDCRRRGYGDA